MGINLAALTVLTTLALFWQPVANGAPPFRGRLYAATSRWEPANLDAAGDTVLIDTAVRPRFGRFVRCLAEFRSQLPETTDFFQDSARPHRRSLERALVCTSQAPSIASLAADYAQRATILYEWEGDYTSPLAEATSAEQFIEANPRSPLAPYLDLFVAARMRYAFELLDGARGNTEMLALARKYQAFLSRAQSADPLVALIADDLDGLAYVYRDVGKHPRDFR